VNTVKRDLVIGADARSVWDAILAVEVDPPEKSTLKVLGVERHVDGRLARITCDLTFGGKTSQQVVEYGYPDPYVITSRVTPGSLVTKQDQVYRLREIPGGTHLAYELDLDLNLPVPGFMLKPLLAKEAKSLCERIRQLAEGS
jgi:hypothetical protein